MNKYEVIVESLQEQVDAGVLTLENAEMINDLAYEKYVTEKVNKKKVLIGTAVFTSVLVLLVMMKKYSDNKKDKAKLEEYEKQVIALRAQYKKEIDKARTECKNAEEKLNSRNEYVSIDDKIFTDSIDKSLKYDALQSIYQHLYVIMQQIRKLSDSKAYYKQARIKCMIDNIMVEIGNVND